MGVRDKAIKEVGKRMGLDRPIKELAELISKKIFKPKVKAPPSPSSSKYKKTMGDPPKKKAVKKKATKKKTAKKTSGRKKIERELKRRDKERLERNEMMARHKREAARKKAEAEKKLLQAQAKRRSEPKKASTETEKRLEKSARRLRKSKMVPKNAKSVGKFRGRKKIEMPKGVMKALEKAHSKIPKTTTKQKVKIGTAGAGLYYLSKKYKQVKEEQEKSKKGK